MERNQLKQGRVPVHCRWDKMGTKHILQLRNERGLGRWAKWLDGRFSKWGLAHGPWMSMRQVHDDKMIAFHTKTLIAFFTE